LHQICLSLNVSHNETAACSKAYSVCTAAQGDRKKQFCHVKRRTSQLQRNNEESAAEIISLRCEEKLQVLREITKAYNIQATHLLHRFRNTTRGISAD